LREAERRVNAHAFKGVGDSHLVSIPADVDTDTDLLLIRAAAEIELLRDLATNLESSRDWWKRRALAGVSVPPFAENFEQWRDSTAAKVADEIALVPPNLNRCSAASDGIHNLYSIESGAWVYEVGCENCKLEIAGRHGPAETKGARLCSAPPGHDPDCKPCKSVGMPDGSIRPADEAEDQP
jgi:hypothetical protein